MKEIKVFSPSLHLKLDNGIDFIQYHESDDPFAVVRSSKLDLEYALPDELYLVKDNILILIQSEDKLSTQDIVDFIYGNNLPKFKVDYFELTETLFTRGIPGELASKQNISPEQFQEFMKQENVKVDILIKEG